jgi:GGDEF domain-containing protein
MGLLPNFLVEVLLEDYLSSTVKPEKTNECKSNENREVEEKADEILENLIESLNNLASNPDKVKKQVSAGIDFISSRISSAKDSFSQLDTAFQEAKLVKLLEEANELGVSTKGFTKKVLAKIEEIKK